MMESANTRNYSRGEGSDITIVTTEHWSSPSFSVMVLPFSVLSSKSINSDLCHSDASVTTDPDTQLLSKEIPDFCQFQSS